MTHVIHKIAITYKFDYSREIVLISYFQEKKGSHYIHQFVITFNMQIEVSDQQGMSHVMEEERMGEGGRFGQPINMLPFDQPTGHIVLITVTLCKKSSGIAFAG